MKRFKIFIGFMAVVITAAFVVSCTKDNPVTSNNEQKFETRSSSITGDCLQDLISDCTGSLDVDTFTYPIPIYGNCTASVTWIEYLCEDPGTGSILNVSFVDVVGWPIAGQCDSVILAWNNLFNTGQFPQLNQAILDFQSDVEKAFTKYRMKQLLDLGVWPCDGSGAYLQAKLYKASCQFTYRLECTPKGGGGQTISVPYIGSCGESCCKSTVWWCRDSNGNDVPSLPLIEQLGSCEGPRVYPVPPKKFCTIWQEGVCIDRCNE
jgi:hypothetical protein